jgi:hypothetical protein
MEKGRRWRRERDGERTIDGERTRHGEGKERRWRKEVDGEGMEMEKGKGGGVNMPGCLSIKFRILGIEDVTSRRSRAYRLSHSTDLAHCTVPVTMQRAANHGKEGKEKLKERASR